MNTFLVRAVLPVALTVLLFTAALWYLLIPALEESIMAQKRELLRELTATAGNILAQSEAEERAGRLTRAAAQAQAIAQIRTLQYGQEGKDYFWINDTHPRMVVHPYRADLEGQDLTAFRDAAGKYLFVAFVRTALRDGAGFVAYRWQWKDDPARIEPKLSYVKLFAPWGWIIGTGVYTNDVQDEVAALRRNLLAVAGGILALIALLLRWNLAGHYRTERARREAETALRASEEKYRLLVESAEGNLLMALAGEPLYANPSMLRLLGHDAASLARLTLDDLIVPTEAERQRGERRHHALQRGETVAASAEGHLRRADGTLLTVVLSLAPVTVRGRSGIIAVAADLSAQREQQLRQEQALADLQLAVAFLNRTAGEACGPAEGTPAAAVPATMLLSEIYPSLERNGFMPLAVTDERGQTIGSIGLRELAAIQHYAPTRLLRAIAQAATPDDMVVAARTLPALIGALMDGGVRTRRVNRFITSVADAVVARAVQFAIADLGEPPVPFAFMVMGSEGRHEQTLRTDQDNAIIYADVPAAQAAEVQAYFLALAAQVCDLSAQAGYAHCKGDVMARNPQWCASLAQWRETFRTWVQTLEPMDLMQSKIFFDFRAACGDRELVAALRAHLRTIIPAAPRFLPLLALNVLKLAPPLGAFGSFVLDTAADGRRTFDCKLAMTPIVDFARLYALQQGVDATNTSDRLDALRAGGTLDAAAHEELVHAYRGLMRLRLEHQVRAIRDGREPDNLIAPAALTAIDRRMLTETFAQIRTFQTRLSREFAGGAERL